MRGGRTRAFTLIELLTVITIIVLLTGLLIGVGARVFATQRERATRNVVTTLDRALEEYISIANVIPPFVPEFYDGTPGPSNGLVQPGGAQIPQPHRPDAAVFVFQALGRGAVDEILQGIPDRFLVITSDSAIPLNAENEAGSAGGPGDGPADPDDQTPSVIDAWGEVPWPADPDNTSDAFPASQQSLIYYVHPDNTVAAAIYGQPINDRPYFVSAGADGFYGHPSELPALRQVLDPDLDDQERLRLAREDNLYSYRVETDFLVRPESLIGELEAP